MARRFKNHWTLLTPVLYVLALAVACSSATLDPTVTLEPTSTPVQTVDLAALGGDASDLDALGLTEADIQCLGDEVETEVVEQLLGDDLSPADVLSVLPALQTCGVDLIQLISGADELLADTIGDNYSGLSSLPFTAEQIACLVLIIDAETLESIVGGQTSQESLAPTLEAFGACGIGLAELLSMSAGVDIESAIDEVLADDIQMDLVDIAADLPFTAEQFECLSGEIETDTISALAAGEVNPIMMLSFIGTLTECGVDLVDLGN
jgi:hypothetical protein